MTTPPGTPASAGVIDVVVAAVRAEFADLSDPAQFTRVALRLCLAVLLGALIGFEREMRGSAAGLRTHMLVALGVALIIVAAEQAAMNPEALSRVLQGIFAGIGFLGAGAIIKQSATEHVKGLTTAASIWGTAAIATAAGLGREATAVFATILALVILAVLRRFERRPNRDDRGQSSRDAAPPPSPPR